MVPHCGLKSAHIIPDSDKRGSPIVSHGLSLCEIHHAVFDQNILGVDPDCVVHIRKDILEEKDGPMLKHGLQELEPVQADASAAPCGPTGQGTPRGAVPAIQGDIVEKTADPEVRSRPLYSLPRGAGSVGRYWV